MSPACHGARVFLAGASPSGAMDRDVLVVMAEEVLEPAAPRGPMAESPMSAPWDSSCVALGGEPLASAHRALAVQILGSKDVGDVVLLLVQLPLVAAVVLLLLSQRHARIDGAQLRAMEWVNASGLGWLFGKLAPVA